MAHNHQFCYSAIQAVSDSKGFSTLHNFLFGLSDLGVPHQNVNPKLRLTDADGKV